MDDMIISYMISGIRRMYMSRMHCFRGVWGHPIPLGNPEIIIDLPRDSMFDFGQLNTQFVFQVLSLPPRI